MIPFDFNEYWRHIEVLQEAHRLSRNRADDECEAAERRARDDLRAANRSAWFDLRYHFDPTASTEGLAWYRRATSASAAAFYRALASAREKRRKAKAEAWAEFLRADDEIRAELGMPDRRRPNDPNDSAPAPCAVVVG